MKLSSFFYLVYFFLNDYQKLETLVNETNLYKSTTIKFRKLFRNTILKYLMETEVASRDVTELEEVIVQGEPRTGVSSRVSRMPVVPFGIPKLATEIFIMNPLFHSSKNYPLFKQCVTYHISPSSL